MAKIKIKFKIQGLELEIEGERDAVPQAAKAIGRQFGSMLGSTQNIIDADVEPPAQPSLPGLTPLPASPKRKQRSANSQRTSSEKNSAVVEAIDFKHDPSKYGNPPKEWPSATKALWLLRVMENQAGMVELNGGQIAATFNKHFAQSGEVQSFNINRDLRKLRLKKPVFVNENTVDSSRPWSLTEDGKTQADKLIAEARGGSVS